MHRLTRTTFGQRDTTPYEGFTYDHLGNHLTQDDSGTTTAGLFNAVNEQTKRGMTDVFYDKRGNLTKDDDGQVYFYDRQNLLTRVEKPVGTLIATYSYDALGRRIEKVVNGGDTTRFYWNGWRTIEETDGSASVYRHYVWGATYIDELLLIRDVIGAGGTANADYYVCRNHNSNVIAMLDASGVIVERYDYNPYGLRSVLRPDFTLDSDGLSDTANPYGHQGLHHDEESGHIYDRARMLHVRLHRFMQRDALDYTDGLDLYEQVRSSPLSYNDPLGEDADGWVEDGPPQKTVVKTLTQTTWSDINVKLIKDEADCCFLDMGKDELSRSRDLIKEVQRWKRKNQEKQKLLDKADQLTKQAKQLDQQAGKHADKANDLNVAASVAAILAGKWAATATALYVVCAIPGGQWACPAAIAATGVSAAHATASGAFWLAATIEAQKASALQDQANAARNQAMDNLIKAGGMEDFEYKNTESNSWTPWTPWSPTGKRHTIFKIQVPCP